MTTRFAEYAKRYYTRTADNHVIFRGNISQDKMAHEMSQGGTVKIEPATLSRILNGVRLPTAEQFAALVETLAIPADDLEEMRLALLMDHGEKKGFGIALSSTSVVTTLLVNNIDLLRKAIDEGEFDDAIRLLRELGKTEHYFESADGPSASLLRIAVMTEVEREMLLETLAKAGEEVEVTLLLPDEEKQKDRIEFAITASRLSDAAKEVARWHYLEERDIEEISDRVQMTDEATLAWLDQIHGVLLQRLARDP